MPGRSLKERLRGNLESVKESGDGLGVEENRHYRWGKAFPQAEPRIY